MGIQANGEAAKILPNVPIEIIIPESVANFSGGYLIMKTLNEPIRIEAIPIPIKTLPKKATKNDSAKAKRNAPKAPVNEKEVMIMREPILSSMGPIGIWNKAKD
jgi:hypothetical protein